MLTSKPIREISLNALREACEKAGGQTALSDLIGAPQSTLASWFTRSKRGVPAEYVLLIESVTNVPRHKLRPDLYSGNFIDALPAPEPAEAAE